MKPYLFILLFVFSGNYLFAQTNCVCCDEMHRQFDFWIGEWNVTDTAGNKVGENSIAKIEDSCILSEHWKGAGGGTGSSYNYYDNTDSTWNQLWIDNKGNPLKLKGKFINGKMVLKSEVKSNSVVGNFYDQITWKENVDGTVSQLWERLDEKGNVAKTLFLGIYKRKD